MIRATRSLRPHPRAIPTHHRPRAFAAKKQKVAKLLTEADLAEEAEPHQKAAENALAQAAAIENHLPEP